MSKEKGGAVLYRDFVTILLGALMQYITAARSWEFVSAIVMTSQIYVVTEQKWRIKCHLDQKISSGLKWILFADAILILPHLLYEYFAICHIYTPVIYPPLDRQDSDITKSVCRSQSFLLPRA